VPQGNWGMVEFTGFKHFPRGSLLDLLTRSYGQYFCYDSACSLPWKREWREFDREVFDHPETVGACGFITKFKGEVAGFASWAPRRFPDLGHIGHNCILPSFRGKSLGRQQIDEVLRILRGQGFRRVRVMTGEHPFFTPAQRMYQACGFREIGRDTIVPYSSFKAINYELLLEAAPDLL
jgi:GNAT superfamily N-acetyltransferase